MNITRRLLLGGCVALAIGGGSYFIYQGLPHVDKQPESATIWPVPRPLPDFELTDHTGLPFSRDDFGGTWNLVFFGFTHCPDICPATLQQLAIARSRLVESGANAPRIVLVSVDPERDSPEALAEYIDHFGEGFVGVTGNMIELRKITSAAGIFFQRVPTSNGEYSVDHSAVVLLINDDAAIHASFSAPHTIENFVRDVPIIVASY